MTTRNIFSDMKATIMLKTIRQAKGLKQAELAKLIGVTQSAIAHYEKGTRPIESPKLTALANALGASTDEILGFKPVEMEDTKKAVHGNSRTAQIQELFVKLKPIDQRALLKQAKALAKPE
jgi:transcriptional regulator with XRE-family HTH domain